MYYLNYDAFQWTTITNDGFMFVDDTTVYHDTMIPSLYTTVEDEYLKFIR
jgi:hypothetical protein